MSAGHAIAAHLQTMQSAIEDSQTIRARMPERRVAPRTTCPIVREGQATLLVLDDEDAVRRLWTHMAEAAGYQVFATATVDETVQLLTDCRVHLSTAIVDWQLASGDAAHAVYALLKLGVPVLIMTGYPQDVGIAAAEKAGARVGTKGGAGGMAEVRAWLREHSGADRAAVAM